MITGSPQGSLSQRSAAARVPLLLKGFCKSPAILRFASPKDVCASPSTVLGSSSGVVLDGVFPWRSRKK